MTDRAHMPQIERVANLLCYEELLAAEDDDFDWPQFDENTASSLCYTSGTTGNPKGVLFSHRSTLLHALGTALPDVNDYTARSTVLPIVPMFHVNAWGIPYAAPLVGAKLVLPGAGARPREPVRAVRAGEGELLVRRAHGVVRPDRLHASRTTCG